MKKRVVMILMALSIACTATACSSGEDRVMEWCEESFSQTEEQWYQDTEEIMAEEEHLDGLLETGPVDIDQLPSILEPIPGYYPYVMRYRYEKGEPMQERVPGFVVDGKCYTIQDAVRNDIIIGVAAYTPQGEPCEVIDLARVLDQERKVYEITGSVVYVFYVKEGLEVQLVPYDGIDLIMAGDANRVFNYWKAAMQEWFGYESTYQICKLAPERGSSFDGTVGVVQNYLASTPGQNASGSSNHYYWRLTEVSIETVDMGGY